MIQKRNLRNYWITASEEGSEGYSVEVSSTMSSLSSSSRSKTIGGAARKPPRSDSRDGDEDTSSSSSNTTGSPWEREHLVGMRATLPAWEAKRERERQLI